VDIKIQVADIADIEDRFSLKRQRNNDGVAGSKKRARAPRGAHTPRRR
jgi:hypothetical protein